MDQLTKDVFTNLHTIVSSNDNGQYQVFESDIPVNKFKTEAEINVLQIMKTQSNSIRTQIHRAVCSTPIKQGKSQVFPLIIYKFFTSYLCICYTCSRIMILRYFIKRSE